jgi:hypothetical protein
MSFSLSVTCGMSSLNDSSNLKLFSMGLLKSPTRAVTTPRLRWLPTRAHMNWPRQEDYVPASESRTQARTRKNNLELQMND